MDADLSIGYKLLTAGAAACFADFATFPLDTAKVRLQVQGEARPLMALEANGEALLLRSGVQYQGLFGTIGTIAKEEGSRALYNGLSAGLQRQMCFASIRLGLYDHFKNLYQKIISGSDSNKNNGVQIAPRVLAGLTTGGLAVLCAQPTDVVKVRFQAYQQQGAPYTSTLQAYRTIAVNEGARGLWKGTFPNVGRNAIVNVAEIVCYDIIKEIIIKRRIMDDSVPCHFTSAVIAGFCATIAASPVDVVKTRYMNSPNGRYSGALECAIEMLTKEGPAAFYKGFTPSFCRLVSWNIVLWITYEQLKRVVKSTCQEE